jgi:hypothetical protein
MAWKNLQQTTLVDAMLIERGFLCLNYWQLLRLFFLTVRQKCAKKVF